MFSVKSLLPARLKKGRKEVLAMLPKGGIGAEIGVWRGDFSAQILRVCRPRQFYLIDPWMKVDDVAHERAKYGRLAEDELEAAFRHTSDRFKHNIASGQVTLLRKKSGEALREFADAHFDYLYLDGDHTYEGIREDLSVAKRKIKGNGFICGDDYTLNGWWKDGVVRAVHEAL